MLTIINTMNSVQLRAVASVLSEMPESEERAAMLSRIQQRLGHLIQTPAKLQIDYDNCCDNPLDSDNGDGWRLISFSRRHSNFKDPYGKGLFIEDSRPSPELQAKLDAENAFLLSYFEHSDCMWFREGTRPNIPDMRWDGVQVAGILFCPEDFITLDIETRHRTIDSVLDEYTDWCNGRCYMYTIKNDEGEVIDSLGGFIGAKHLVETLREEYPELWTGEGDDIVPSVKVDGEAADILKYIIP